jgi:hypothetical protein
MRILNLLICVLALAAWAQEGPIETGAAIRLGIRCNPECYSTYIHLMGDTLEYINWVQQSLSYQDAAANLCAVEQCSACRFCHLLQPVDEAAQTSLFSAEAKKTADTGEIVSCMAASPTASTTTAYCAVVLLNKQ